MNNDVCALAVDEWCGDRGRHCVSYSWSCIEAKKGKPDLCGKVC